MRRRGRERVAEDLRQVERIRSRLSMVFQQFNLWSHMTVLQNVIEAPIRVLKVPKAEAIERAEAVLRASRHGGSSRCLARTPLRRTATTGGHRSRLGDGNPKSCFSTSRLPPWTPSWSAGC